MPEARRAFRWFLGSALVVLLIAAVILIIVR